MLNIYLLEGMMSTLNKWLKGNFLVLSTLLCLGTKNELDKNIYPFKEFSLVTKDHRAKQWEKRKKY